MRLISGGALEVSGKQDASSDSGFLLLRKSDRVMCIGPLPSLDLLQWCWRACVPRNEGPPGSPRVSTAWSPTVCNTRPPPPPCIGTTDGQVTPLTRYSSQRSPLQPLTSLDCVLTRQDQCQLAEGSGAESQLGVGPGAWPWAVPCPGSRKGSDPTAPLVQRMVALPPLAGSLRPPSCLQRPEPRESL